jgi:hypothetical protein
MRYLGATLITAMLAAAPAAHGQMYTWTDEHGTKTFSNKLPADLDSVRNFGVVEGSASLSAAERRTLEILREESNRTGPAPSAGHARSFEIGNSYPSASPRRVTRWRGHTETVRDPCLISSDPTCYERNKENYDPRLGYAPSVLRAETGEGATSTSAGGFIAGEVGRVR